MSSLGERLRELRSQKGLTQADFGSLAGVTKRSQMLYESDQRIPRADYLAALDDAGLDVRYVLTGKRSEPDTASSLVIDDDPDDGHIAVPMYDIEAAAGTGRFFEHENVEEVLYFDVAQLIAEGLTPGELVGAKVRGDSMGETLRDGDRVVVDLSKRTPDGVFLLRMGDELRIKRVQRVAGGAWLLISDNDHYQPELVKPEDMHDVEILGQCEIRIGRIV